MSLPTLLCGLRPEGWTLPPAPRFERARGTERKWSGRRAPTDLRPRALEALQMRSGGSSYKQIMAVLGYSSTSAVNAALRMAVAK